jgi:hypothetical protein
LAARSARCRPLRRCCTTKPSFPCAARTSLGRLCPRSPAEPSSGRCAFQRQMMTGGRNAR